MASAEEIFSAMNCNLDYEIYKDFQHIKSDGTNRKLGSIGEFCAASYHVSGNGYCCLDTEHCQVADMVKDKAEKHDPSPKWTPPKSVVALVKYEIDDGSHISVRYSNHRKNNTRKHAEEFFSDDIKNMTLSSSVSGKTLKKITMYITFQPCHRSTLHTPGKSCCDVLLGLLGHPRLNGVEIFIKPTHIYKAGEQHRKSLEKQGRIGIWLLKHRKITITRMEKNDWKDLFDLVDMDESKRQSILSGYSESARKHLDEEISEFFRDIKTPPPIFQSLKIRANDSHIAGPSGGGSA